MVKITDGLYQKIADIGETGEGVKNLEKLLTLFMDGPLILTQLTVVENVFNIKQKPERLHFKVGDLKSGNQGLYPGPSL